MWKKVEKEQHVKRKQSQCAFITKLNLAVGLRVQTLAEKVSSKSPAHPQ